MKKLLLLAFLVTSFSFLTNDSKAQRILIYENFDTLTLVGDSLPPGWLQFDADFNNVIGTQWAVRDTGTTYPGANAQVVVAKAFTPPRALTIPWTAGNPVADDWCYTNAVDLEVGDSLIFMLLHGSTPGITAYLDSLQVYVSQFQFPGIETYIGTIVSNDSAGVPLANNEWKEVKFDLSAFAGQTLYIAWRFYCNTSVDGLWANIDNVFVGNMSAVNINPIGSEVPERFALSQNYPNPFNPSTKIKFDIAKATNVKLTVYNSLGQVVRVLQDGQMTPGSYEAEFNSGVLSSGMYFYRIETDFYTDTKKMMLVK